MAAAWCVITISRESFQLNTEPYIDTYYILYLWLNVMHIMYLPTLQMTSKTGGVTLCMSVCTSCDWNEQVGLKWAGGTEMSRWHQCYKVIPHKTRFSRHLIHRRVILRKDCCHAFDICTLKHNWEIINWSWNIVDILALARPSLRLHNVSTVSGTKARIGLIWSFVL